MNALTGDDLGPTGVSLLASLTVATKNVSVRLNTCGRWSIIVVTGEMDIQVLPLLPGLRGDVATHVVFDLLGVTFMDACALGALVGGQVRVTRSGGCMRLVAHPKPVLRLLQITGTSDVFRTFDTLVQALHAPVPKSPDRAA